MADKYPACWITSHYGLQVLQFDNNYAGLILLVGQLADGLSTTLVGGLCDLPQPAGLCRVYGQKKTWHLVGTACVLLSFPFIFLPCLAGGWGAWQQMLYYSFFAVIFQFGWAAVQISHLALIPALTQSQDERTGLTAIRYSMTVVCNMTVFLVTWAFLGVSGGTQINIEDTDSFRNIMLVVIGLGTLARYRQLNQQTNRLTEVVLQCIFPLCCAGGGGEPLHGD